jgi:tRNA (adenine37-N6)-methyltransferase
MREARERGAAPITLTILELYRPALTGLDRASHVIALGWFADAARNRLIQQPPHLAEQVGALALRSPDRPNPIALSIPRLLGVDISTGVVTLDALDWFDGTPLIDLKPYYPSVDIIPDASIREPSRKPT